MAWNEPDDQNKEKKSEQDPWSGRQQGKKDGAPPDLDAMLQQGLRNLRALFGLGKRRTGGSSGGDGGGGALAGKGAGLFIAAVALVFVIFWVLAGIYIIQPAQQAVVLRFGRYVDTVQPGPHWRPLFIDTIYKLDVQKVYNFSYQAKMLTKDENIVDVAVAVQYRVSGPRNFLFNIVNPVTSLQLATASALRQVVGDTTLNSVLTTGRSLVGQEVTKQLEVVLKRYQAGITITDVALQSAQAPDEVRAAFDDAIKAREDEQRYINQAQTYQEKAVQKAQGMSKQLLLSAKAYQQQVMLQAQGDTAQFLALLPQYQFAPRVMRERMYLETVQSMLSKSSKILIDSKSGQNVMLLPLKSLLTQALTTGDVSKTRLNLSGNVASDADESEGSGTSGGVSTGSGHTASQANTSSMRPPRPSGYGNIIRYQGGSAGY